MLATYALTTSHAWFRAASDRHPNDADIDAAGVCVVDAVTVSEVGCPLLSSSPRRLVLNDKPSDHRRPRPTHRRRARPHERQIIGEGTQRQTNKAPASLPALPSVCPDQILFRSLPDQEAVVKAGRSFTKRSRRSAERCLTPRPDRRSTASPSPLASSALIGALPRGRSAR